MIGTILGYVLLVAPIITILICSIRTMGIKTTAIILILTLLTILAVASGIYLIS